MIHRPEVNLFFTQKSITVSCGEKIVSMEIEAMEGATDLRIQDTRFADQAGQW